MRLIDADDLPSDVMLHVGEDDDEFEFVYMYDIEHAPTIDAVPVKHGRWIYKGVRGRFPVCECSVCGNAENADWAVLGNNVNYCPNCGAKMDVERRK